MQNSSQDIPVRYRERLTPGLPVFVALTLAAPMVALSFLPINAMLGVGIGIAATLALFALAVWLSPVITVRGAVLSAGRAHIDVSWLGDAAEYEGAEAERLRRADLDVRGWHLIRGGIKGIVRVPNTDPADPVTTWTISSRTPNRLAAAINAARIERP